MSNGRWSDHEGVLRRQGRLKVVRAATLEADGLERATIYRRCLPGGPWRRLLPGIILLDRAEPTADQRAVAASLYSGPRALITGLEACRRHGLRSSQLPEDSGIHMLVPHRHKLQSSGFVTIERTLRLPEPAMRNGFFLAPLVRSTLDAARCYRDTDLVAKLLIEAIQKGRCSWSDLMQELNSGGQRGTALPRRLLREIKDLRSVAELHGRNLAGSLAVPPTHWNHRLYGTDGRYIGCPDAWWDDVGLAWEIDSYDFHFWRSNYAETLRRNSRYAGAGIIVVQTLPSRLLHDPEDVLIELAQAYKAATARPRPPVDLVARAA
jgi:hypothetical protein